MDLGDCSSFWSIDFEVKCQGYCVFFSDSGEIVFVSGPANKAKLIWIVTNIQIWNA
mgnify:CR=1 FL=1